MVHYVLACTDNGRVKGVKKISALGSAYCAFYGVPYAAPPIGEKRFKESIT